MTAKERNKIKLLEYLGNPLNKPVDRVTLATKVLGYSKSVTIYRFFTPEELSEIEYEAKELRRKRYAIKLMQIDDAMMDQALEGNDRAAKLCYQRFEDWGERKVVDANLGIKVELVNYGDFKDEIADQNKKATLENGIKKLNGPKD